MYKIKQIKDSQVHNINLDHGLGTKTSNSYKREK